MYDESVLMVREDASSSPIAKLLFPATKIHSLRDPTLQIEYRSGVDYSYDAPSNTLRLLAGSRALAVPRSDVVFNEGSYYHDRQLMVTYEHTASNWTGPRPQLANATLSRTLLRLNSGVPLKLVLYGDSISEGFNASGFAATRAQPYQQSWGELVCDSLRQAYASSITFKNKALRGTTSTWGAQNVDALVRDERPDLVIIAFGMNDGAAPNSITADAFKANVQTMITRVRSLSPNADFVLVTPTLPRVPSLQATYKAALSSLVGPGVALADMTGVHQTLLASSKRFEDMTGNNVNHPNDFLIRWYAQTVAGLLVP